MQFKAICFLWVATGCWMHLAGQQLVKKRAHHGLDTEQFHVLKEDKTIRQGSALTVHEGVLNQQYVVEYGQYNHNDKDGLWLSFYYVEPGNSLKSKGVYKHNLKEGVWRYYYPAPSGRSVQVLFGSEKRTQILPEKKDEYLFRINYDTTGQHISCVGKYEGDKKVGVWNYYSRSGYLLQQYDHSAGRFVQNRIREENNDFLVFLGGYERFSSCYNTVNQELESGIPPAKSSEVIYEVDRNGHYLFVSNTGDAVFKEGVDKTLKALPDEWIFLKEGASGRLHIISKVEVSEGGFNKYSYSLDFKVVK